ncbi:MAG TPA: DUF711 family protein, partial [Candidatus Nitrosotenuis sp.]|nr:DUF711 family protein [Candidatus Nitrosotenuis sp.]
LALEEMEGAPRASLSELRTRLVERFAVALAGVDRLGRLLEENSGVRFLGIDASFAPLPHGGPSVARLVEALAGGPVGCPGTLFATAFLTDLLRAALDMSEARTVGFNGVMYSVLEDDVLAAASHKRTLTLEGLMACAALCGCGLDMVPLPGGIFSEELAGLTMDVAALALRLSKPLGVRLLPIPGRVVNERTSFNLDFLCDARILAVPHRDHAGPGEEAPFRYLTPPSQRAPAARTPS